MFVMRDSDVGKVGVDGFHDLIVVVGKFLKLEIKVVQPGDELRLRGVAADDFELLAEDTFDDKTAAVMFQSGLCEQFVETDVLLFIELERVFITRCSGLLSGLIHQFSIGIIYSLKRVATRERPRPCRASTFVCRKVFRHTKVQLATI